MPLLIHLRNCKGQGGRLEANSATIQLGNGTIQLADCTYLTFSKGLLELVIDHEIHKIELGEGFAALEESEISLVTNYYCDSGGEFGAAAADLPKSN